MQHKSLFDNDCDITKEKWRINLVNTNTKTCDRFAGHTVIVIEGIFDDGRYFIGEYELKTFLQVGDNLQSTLGNTQGVIAEVRCRPTREQRENKTVTQFDKPYRKYAPDQFTLKHWIVTPQEAMRVIKATEKESEKIATEFASAKLENRLPGNLPKYQKAGAYRWSIFGTNKADNCATWADKKLILANINVGKKCSDSYKASPEFHITGCTIS